MPDFVTASSHVPRTRRASVMPAVLAAGILLLNACQTATIAPVNPAKPLTTTTRPSTDPSASAAPVTGGSIDLGFRSKPDGFSFENGSGQPFSTKVAGSDYLTIADMQQMFGDANVCTGKTSGARCVPTPAAKKWHDKINHGMNGGQCEGMAVLALSLFKGIDTLAGLEAGKATTFDLGYGSGVREKVGLYFAYQYTQEVLKATVKGSPTEVLNRLRPYLAAGTKDPVTLGFYGEDGGHATTPYAIEDVGNGVFHIKMYDNNWPGQERYIEVDTQADTWIYNFAATNPTEPANAWKGDASTQSLEFTPLSTRLNKATCPYCNKGDQASGSRQIYLSAGASGKAHLRVVDKRDPSHFVGWDPQSQRYVNHLAGAEMVGDRSVVKQGDMPAPPMIEVPAGQDYQILVDGQDLKAAEQVKISIFGQGKSMEVSNISLDPSQQDTLSLGADDDSLKYKPGHSANVESPIFRFGYDNPNGKDYALEVKNLDAKDGEEISTDFEGGKLRINDSEDEADDYDLVVDSFDEDGTEESFSKDGISLGADDTDNIDFGDWQGQGDSMKIGPDGAEVDEPDVDGDDDSDSEADDF